MKYLIHRKLRTRMAFKQLVLDTHPDLYDVVEIETDDERRAREAKEAAAASRPAVPKRPRRTKK